MSITTTAVRVSERLDTMQWRVDATILIVEDDRNIGHLVGTYLERDGYRVAWVRSGEEALAEVDRLRPGLVVLDVGCPASTASRSADASVLAARRR